MESLYATYKSGYSESPDSAIRFFKENALIFNNVSHFNNEEELRMFMDVYVPCICAFVSRKQFKNAIAALKLLPVIENAIDDYKINRSEYISYKELLFRKGMSLYYLRDFKQAKTIFNTLQVYEPENDLVKTWIEHCKLKQLNRFLYLVPVIIVVSILIDVVFKTNKYQHHILSIITYTLMAIAFGLMIYIQIKSNRKLISSK